MLPCSQTPGGASPAWTITRPFTSRVGIRAVLFVLALGLTLAPRASVGQTPGTPGATSAQGLTQALVALDARYWHASPAARGDLLRDLLDLAAKRKEVLATLIEDNPGEVLKFTLRVIQANFRTRGIATGPAIRKTRVFRTTCRKQKTLSLKAS